MLYLLWAILNTAAYIYFIYVLVIGGKLVRQKLGLLAAFIFVFGLFAFIGVRHDDDDNVKPGTNQTKKWKQYSSDNLEKNIKMSNWIVIDSNLISSYSLFYTHGRIKGSTERIPLEASSTMSGMAIGTHWKPCGINMDPTNNGQFKYTVFGTVEWYLLGINIYTQEKTYTGTAPAINHE